MTAFNRVVKVCAAAMAMAAFGVMSAPSAVAQDRIDDGQWYHSLLRTSAAHRVTQGAGVTVAVIDTGVDATHPDLAGAVLPGADFTDAGPGDGWLDTDGHGTAMAGLIAAHGRVTGVAPAARILPVRMDSGGDLARGILWAVEQKVGVISISRMLLDEDIVVRQAVEEALAADIVVVAGTGNRTESTTMSYLARIRGVVAVGGVDRAGNHSAISVSGAETLLAAPCDEVSSTYPGGEWAVATGTSNSTALVAGAAALVRARFPNMPAAEVVHRLVATAIDKGFRGPDGEYGHGLIDIAGALTKNVSPFSPSPSPSPSDGSATTSSGQAGPGSSAPWKRVLIPAVVGLVVVSVVLGIGFLSRRRS
ncbi:S8 family serine peptidase [Catellatospora bangladeshensis]|uniref:Type VII secretion-associated serine protease n=1 Tax=Catellatospora bangladeshensis TaxID=310355 RepID=A0A8J3NHM0_9ACTN|nr:S8 family serine peptidase [Catellatospora bangladeshensis]GIF81372.1 type VII secretion-associated serine protease [Catellatospora bangladeshensis]